MSEAETETLGGKERGEQKQGQLTPADPNQAAVAIFYENLVHRLRISSPIKKLG